MNTKEKIAVMQAFVDGATIQFLYHSNTGTEWRNVPEHKEPMWDFAFINYRIKPADPRTIYTNEYHDGAMFLYEDRGEAIRARAPNGKTTKWVEALESNEEN